MSKGKTPLAAAVAAALLLSAAPALQAVEMYRYVNEQGNTVLGYQVPVGDIKKGYEVLNEDGIVMKVVPRELTEAELKDREAREKLEAAAAAEQERLRLWDESLLMRYSTVDDIEAARTRALSSLLINVSILKSNIRSLKQQVENYQSQAADIERRGGQVDVERLTAIEDLQNEIEATERSIVDRKVEMEVVEADYEKDIDRFEQLLDVVEMRRSMLATDSK
jgi:hypothetical protein